MTQRVRTAPLRAVVESRRGSGCQQLKFPDGSVAVICGPAPYLDRLECGHEVVAYSRAQRRRCTECAEAVAS